MKLNNTVLIAVVGVAIISGIFYFCRDEKPRPKSFMYALDQRSKEIKLSLDNPIYSGEKTWLATMFRSANNTEDHAKKQKMLQKVIALALTANDFNVALMAVLKMDKKKYISYENIIKMLNLIVDKAIATKNLDYAYLAVNQYPTCSSKAKVESKVVEAYTKSISNVRI